MIIACEKCKTKFNLDESLLKAEGSKVRCSICEHVFKAYPKKASPESPDTIPRDVFQKTQEVDIETIFEDKDNDVIAKKQPDVDMDFEVPAEEEMPDQIPEEEEDVVGATSDAEELFEEEEHFPPMGAEEVPL